MLEWIATNREWVALVLQTVTAVVWIIYLHILIASFRRQKRSNILIARVAGNQDQAHLLVGNMGAEPIFVSALILDLEFDSGAGRSVVTDTTATDIDPDDPISRTWQGPMDSGHSRDMGSFGAIVDKALNSLGTSENQAGLDALTVTIAAEGSSDSVLVAGQRRFWVRRANQRRVYLPQTSDTHQIRSGRERRKVARRLRNALRLEADTVDRLQQSCQQHPNKHTA